MEKMKLMLTFILWLMLPASATNFQQSSPIPLSMMGQSVDDMFSGCAMEMAMKVKNVYFPREMKYFRRAWVNAEKCANYQYNTRKNKALTKNHLKAICAYTEETPNMYEPFNKAVRSSAAKYTTPAFRFHALYFWLSSALKILRIDKPCRITYRRTDVAFTGKVNQMIRFGSFTSSTKDADLIDFGTETCFHIRSCLGAYIKNYSSIKGEREVLIPPYEKFQIMKITKGSFQGLKNCNTIFVLRSVGHLSNLNCKAVQKWKPISDY